MSTPRCPICKQPAPAMPENKAFPFCSDRCRMVDLGKWLNADYRIPVRSDDENDDEMGSGDLH